MRSGTLRFYNTLKVWGLMWGTIGLIKRTETKAVGVEKEAWDELRWNGFGMQMDTSKRHVKKWDLELSGHQDFGVICAEDIWTSMGSPRVRAQKWGRSSPDWGRPIFMGMERIRALPKLVMGLDDLEVIVIIIIIIIFIIIFVITFFAWDVLFP